LGCNRAQRQANSRTNHLQGEKHVCCRIVPVEPSQGTREVSGFQRWWNLVSAGLPVPGTEAPHPFSFGEKPDRKDYAVHKGQDGML